MNAKNIGKLVMCVLLTIAVGGLSGFLIKDDITGWYATINKPSFNPPNAIFGPVWTTLYVLMGISFYMVLNTLPGKERTKAIAVFCAQLFLNFWWSIFFFSFKQVTIAMVDIVAMWAFILWMIIAFARLKPLAGYLQIPYLLWVSFASLLNFEVMILN